MVTRKRPVRQKKEPRLLIAQKAGELFRQEGYHAVTVEQISKSLGISKPSIYYHYGSKEEIFFEVHRIAHIRAFEGLKGIMDRDDPPEVKLRLSMEYHIDLLSFEVTPTMIDLHREFSLPREFSEPIKKLRSQYDKLLRGVISDGTKEGVFVDLDIEVVGFAIEGAINFIPQWYSAKGPLSQGEIKEIMVDYLMRCILR